ncbi:hypothetical protein HPP92_006449 [Vanilla planifolia]|uniref:Uncharacterized protein n=1 Tax=Vanilla planifolia TaxID=51239 RepID=A0A835RQN9_VANPL|nr:hypothetical protein HPP92_006449 [Vanilla planifolia]
MQTTTDPRIRARPPLRTVDALRRKYRSARRRFSEESELDLDEPEDDADGEGRTQEEEEEEREEQDGEERRSDPPLDSIPP